MTTTDTALTRLRADIAANRPWVDYWEWCDGPRFVTVFDDDGEPMTPKQAVGHATARALEYLRKRESLLWIKNKLQQNWQVEVSTYEALAAACDAVKEPAR